jgi:hypothetical protein
MAKLLVSEKELLKAIKEAKNPTLYKFINRAVDDLKENPFCGYTKKIDTKNLH